MERIAVGIGVRDDHLEPLLLLSDRSSIDVLEVMIDDGLEEGPRRAAWRRLGARWPLIAHGTELGIGDAHGPDATYMARVGATLESMQVLWYSEHLSFLRTAELDLGHFAPLDHGEEALAVLADNASATRAACPCPLLLENPADVLGWQKELSGLSLGKAFGASLEAACAGGLLDLTNLVLGARNDGYVASAFLDGVPLDRVVEVHLAGGRFDGNLWIDSHDHPVDHEALGLLRWVVPRAPNLRAIVIERDERLPPLSALLDEVANVRRILVELGRA